MERSATSAPQYSTAVRTAGSAALDLLLSAAAGERGEPAPDAPARRAVHEAPVLRQPQDGCRVGDQSQTRATVDAHSGHRSSLPQTQLEPTGAGSRSVPVPAAWRRHRKAKSRLEHRYYVHSDAGRLSLPGCGDGLVQPLRAQLGTLQHHGDGLLPGRAPRCVPLRTAHNLELRSGLAVHVGRFPGATQEARHRDQHGWPRTCARQRVHRTVVALAQVRTDLPRRLRHRPGTVSGAGELLPLLQSPASAPGAGLPDAVGPVPAPVQKEEVIAMMGAPPPNPRDLSLLSSRMDAFCFTRNGTCRTIDLLARRIGQRRDATRAPMQVRNGWRPSGRRLAQPAALSKNGRFFVQPMGSTSKYLARNCRFDRNRQDLLFMMNLELKQPNRANLTICVELRVRIVTKVFKQPQIPPAFRSDGRVPPAGNQNESVNREIGCLLLDQPIIHPRKRLLAKLPRRRIRQDVAFQPVMVRILTSAMEALHGSHDNCSQNYFGLQRKADTAGIRYLERSKDILV